MKTTGGRNGEVDIAHTARNEFIPGPLPLSRMMIILALIFTGEMALMVGMRFFAPSMAPTWCALLDASLLTAIVFPFLYLFNYKYMPLAPGIVGVDKAFKDELERSERQMRAIIKSVGEGVVVIDCAERIMMVNEELLNIFGYKESELVGGSIQMLMPEKYRDAHRAGLEAYLKGRPPKLLGRRIEIEGLNKNGTVFPIELRIEETIEEGGGHCFTAAIRDITSRKQSERSLEDSQIRYRMLVEGVRIIGWEYNPAEDRFTFVSGHAEEISGWTAEEWRQKGFWAEHIHPEDRQQAVEFCVNASARGEAHEFEYRMMRKDGKIIWVRDIVQVVLKDGKTVKLRGVLVDITEQKQADDERIALETKVLQVQKLESLGVLAGGIAHDFNNLLMGILGNVDLTRDEIPHTSPAREYVVDIETAAKRAAELSRQMLAYSGKGRYLVEPLNLNNVIKEMTRLLDASISKKIALQYNLAENIPTVKADATQTRQVVMNLIINASEAIGDNNGVINITTGAMECDRAYLKETYLDENLPEGNYVYLEVSDTGCGMDKNTRDKLFDPFFTTKFTGRGLGMAAVLGIIRGHKGAIRVYSEPGKGATFKILLPASGPQMEQGSEESFPVRDAWRGRGAILLVDDEPGVLKVTSRILKRVGFTTLTAQNGIEAVEIFQKHKDEIVAVIMDLTMPQMDGEEAFRELRRIKADVRVILTSGYNEQVTVNKFVGKGLAGFIQKPYQSAKLIATLRKTIEKES